MSYFHPVSPLQIELNHSNIWLSELVIWRKVLIMRIFPIVVLVLLFFSCAMKSITNTAIVCEHNAEKVLRTTPVYLYNADSTYLIAFKQIREKKSLVLNTLDFIVFDVNKNQEVCRKFGLKNSSVQWHSLHTIKLIQSSGLLKQGGSNKHIKLLDVQNDCTAIPNSKY